MLQILLYFAALSPFVNIAIVAVPDCLSKKCNQTLNPQGIHKPCSEMLERAFVRDVICNDGVTYHICCHPGRDEIQKSRQKIFRLVTKVGNEISPICTKRILCEQSCKDGLRGDVRSDYPEMIEGDTAADQEYVQAFRYGENIVCYGHSSNTTSTSEPYNTTTCEYDCSQKFLQCAQEIKTSKFVKMYYDTSQTFHNLGMWSFDAWWLAVNQLTATNKHFKKFSQIVKTSFSNLLNRIAL